MRDIYINKSELKLKFNPKESKKLLEFNNPELLLNSHTRFYKCPEGFDKSYDTGISSIVCKLLLTNRTHDGIWLIREDDKCKVSIPGGHLGEDVLPSINAGYSYTAIYETIIRELIEENPILKSSFIYDDSNLRESIKFIIHQYGFSITANEYPLFYSYDDELGEFIIYMIKEATEPSFSIVPFSYYGFRNMIWYSRKEHSLNRSFKSDRKSLFNAEFDNDIRITDNGVKLLDKILSTEKIFGNINIY